MHTLEMRLEATLDNVHYLDRLLLQHWELDGDRFEYDCLSSSWSWDKAESDRLAWLDCQYKAKINGLRSYLDRSLIAV